MLPAPNLSTSSQPATSAMRFSGQQTASATIHSPRFAGNVSKPEEEAVDTNPKDKTTPPESALSDRVEGFGKRWKLACQNLTEFYRANWKKGMGGKALVAFDTAMMLGGLIPGLHLLWLFQPSLWGLGKALLFGLPSKHVAPEFVQALNQSP